MALVISRGVREVADNVARGLPSSVPAGPTYGPHGKAVLVAENGWWWEFGLAPVETDAAGFTKSWSQVKRPGRKPLLVDSGPQLRTLGLSVVTRWPGDPFAQVSVEHATDALMVMSGTSMSFVIQKMGVTERGSWRLTDVKIRPNRRQHGTNAVTRQTADLSFVETSNYAVTGYVNNAGPVTGGAVTTPTGSTTTTSATTPTVSAPTSYTVKSGDTLAKISIAMYGTASRYAEIARASGISNPNKIFPGQKLTVPRP